MTERHDERDDPRRTAYALGELDAAERAEIEAQLAADADLRREVDELRDLAEVLGRELKTDPGAGLTDAQRGAIEERLTAAPVHRREGRRGRVIPFRVAAWSGAIAASLALAFGATVWFRTSQGSAEDARPFTYNLFGSDPAATSSGPVDARVARLDDAGKASGEKRGRVRQREESIVASARDQAGRVVPGAPAEQAPRLTQNEVTELRALGYLGDDEVLDEPALQDSLRGLGYIGEPEEGFQTEAYDHVVDNPFRRVAHEPLSTFSIDVDTASYANVRRFLTDGQLPPAGAVRIEELVNYFDYAYPEPDGPVPFSVITEVADCPWRPGHRLVRIGLKGRESSFEARPRSLVFLIDVSGSMNQPDKLPLLKRGMAMLTSTLGERDQVAICVYAGASGLVLPPTPGAQRGQILAALDQLQAGGSTNGGAGIELAYRTAEESFIDGGINRVILASDGDFNVGTTSRDALIRLIEEKRASGVFLSVLGFGTGNLKDGTMEQIANHGNGSYHYIDGENEAHKVLVRDVNATLETIAKDVKIQIELNPAEVQAFRLIGYENRVLEHEDFNDDTVDAGEIGAGHTVTALYEIVPAGVPFEEGGDVDGLRYQPAAETAPQGIANGELMNVKLRWKEPDGATSAKIEVPVMATDRSWTEASEDFRFAAGVALFGMVLRDSPHRGTATAAAAFELATEGAGPDPWGYRAEFLALVQRAMTLGR